MTKAGKSANLSDMIEQTVTSIPGLNKLGELLSNEIHKVATSSETARRITDVLHGTWIGHPLHPILTDLVVGSWSLAAACDALSLVSDTPGPAEAADALVVVGILAAAPTALTGLADYSGIHQDTLATATAHAIGNDIGLTCYVASWWARRSGKRGLGIALAMVGFGVMGVAASLGGALVFRQKVGVNHAPDIEPTDEWTPALADAELGGNQMRRVDIKDAPVLLFRDSGQVYAISAVCTHAGGPLAEGKLEGACVECPWHQSVFDLRDGHVVHGPATIPQPRYATRIRNGQIEVQPLPTSTTTA
jgi:nitrite reductase/ring-hydroxylating ferredoxin subunit/uncharacterized membrane protein